MITFGDFLNEIAVNPEFNIPSKPVVSQRGYSKIAPKQDEFNIIPIRLGYDTYNVFKRYVGPRYDLADRLLDRRGDSVDWVTVKASNEEIANLGELARHIIANAPETMPGRPSYTNRDGEVRTAKSTLDRIEDSMLAASKVGESITHPLKGVGL
ncbi:hypothetical protein EBT16_01340 [bacterium]|nr:hypothetical protein [bacterium]